MIVRQNLLLSKKEQKIHAGHRHLRDKTCNVGILDWLLFLVFCVIAHHYVEPTAWFVQAKLTMHKLSWNCINACMYMYYTEIDAVTSIWKMLWIIQLLGSYSRKRRSKSSKQGFWLMRWEFALFACPNCDKKCGTSLNQSTCCISIHNMNGVRHLLCIKTPLKRM